MDTKKKKEKTQVGGQLGQNMSRISRDLQKMSRLRKLTAAAETDPLTSLATGHFLYALIHPGTTAHIISFHFPAMED